MGLAVALQWPVLLGGDDDDGQHGELVGVEVVAEEAAVEEEAAVGIVAEAALDVDGTVAVVAAGGGGAD